MADLNDGRVSWTLRAAHVNPLSGSLSEARLQPDCWPGWPRGRRGFPGTLGHPCLSLAPSTPRGPPARSCARPGVSPPPRLPLVCSLRAPWSSSAGRLERLWSCPDPGWPGWPYSSTGLLALLLAIPPPPPLCAFRHGHLAILIQQPSSPACSPSSPPIQPAPASQPTQPTQPSRAQPAAAPRSFTSSSSTFVSALCIPPGPHLDSPHPGDTGITLPVLVDIDIDDSRFLQLLGHDSPSQPSAWPRHCSLPPPFFLSQTLSSSAHSHSDQPLHTVDFFLVCESAICDERAFGNCDIHELVRELDAFNP